MYAATYWRTSSIFERSLGNNLDLDGSTTYTVVARSLAARIYTPAWSYTNLGLSPEECSDQLVRD